MHSLLFPILVFIGIFISWKIAVGVTIILWLVIIIDLNKYYGWLDLKPSGIELLLYFPYTLIFSFLFLIYQILPIPIVWKDRKY